MKTIISINLVFILFMLFFLVGSLVGWVANQNEPDQNQLNYENMTQEIATQITSDPERQPIYIRVSIEGKYLVYYFEEVNGLIHRVPINLEKE